MWSLQRRQYSLPTVALLLLVGCLSSALITQRLLFRGPSIRYTQTEGLGLDQVMDELRSELEASELRRLGRATPAIFELKDFDIELEVVAKSSNKEHGKIEYQVVTAEMEHEIGREATHKVTLHMQLAPQAMLQSSSPDKSLTGEGA